MPTACCWGGSEASAPTSQCVLCVDRLVIKKISQNNEMKRIFSRLLCVYLHGPLLPVRWMGSEASELTI